MASASGPAFAGAREQVVAALEAMAARPSYRATTTTTIRGEETTTFEVTVDFVAPSRFHVRAVQGELVIVPQGAWEKVDGSWRRLDEDMSAFVPESSPQAARESIERIRNVRDAGDETMAGCEASHFIYDTEIDVSGRSALVPTDLWICDRTGLPLRATTGDPAGTVTSTVVYDFESKISIATPE